MIEVLKTYNSGGICSICYKELEATIEYRSDGAAYICKTCPQHGYEEAMVEKDYKFWDSVTQLDPNNRTWEVYNDITVTEVTDRCNVNCKHCYHDPDNSIADPRIEIIEARVKKTSTSTIFLMGAEPTMREDLPELIKRLSNIDWPAAPNGKKQIGIYTNGIKFSDRRYVDTLRDAGLAIVCLSVHGSDYHKPAIWKKVEQSLYNIIENRIPVGQMAFTVERKEDMENAIEKVLEIRELLGKANYPKVTDFCIRTPAEIGVPFEQPREIFASEAYKWIEEIANEKGMPFGRHENYGSNPYHVGCLLNNNCHIQLIHWASAKSVDTTMMNMGPYADFIPNTKTTFLMAAILRDGMKNGWFNGHKLWDRDKIRPVSPNRLNTKYNPDIIKKG